MNRVNAAPFIHFAPASKTISNRYVLQFDTIARRFQDILISAAGLLLLIPIFVLIAFFIKRDSPGPIFYRGPRAGLGGKRFGILKFRTMYERPESYAGAKVTAQGDSRITPFGQWLRDTKINELPQLWNVLAGEMSLVGPRPEDPDIAAEWPEDVRKAILSVRPGITSPASVLYRDEEQMLAGTDVMEDYWRNVLPSKLRLDLLYVRSRNILTDLDIIFWTAIVLLPQLRKKPVPEHLLYCGPLSKLFTRVLNWFIVDWLVALAAAGVSGLIWRSQGAYDVGVLHSIAVALAAAMCFSLLNFAFGLHHITWSRASASSAIDLVISAGIMTIILIFANRHLIPEQMYPTRMLLTTGVLASAGYVTVRYRERLLTGLATRWLRVRRVHSGERVLIVGAGEMGHFASWMFKHSDFARAFFVAGMVDDDPHKVGMVVDGNRILGTADQIPDLVAKHDIGVIIFAINRIHIDQRDRILTLCRQSTARVVVFPDLMSYLQSSLRQPEAAMIQQWSKTEPAYRSRERNAVSGPQFDEHLKALETALEQNNLSLARHQVALLRAQYAIREQV